MMRQVKFAIAVACLLTAFNTFADTTETTNTKQTQQQPAQTENKEQKSQSVYESIKSGWNSMLDALMGPATPDNKSDSQ